MLYKWCLAFTEDAPCPFIDLVRFKCENKVTNQVEARLFCKFLVWAIVAGGIFMADFQIHTQIHNCSSEQPT